MIEVFKVTCWTCPAYRMIIQEVGLKRPEMIMCPECEDDVMDGTESVILDEGVLVVWGRRRGRR